LCTLPSQSEKAYFFAWEESFTTRTIQRLDSAYQPVGNSQTITLEEFSKTFTHEPLILAMPLVKYGEDKPTPEPEAQPPEPEVDDSGMSSQERETEARIRRLFTKTVQGLKQPRKRDAAIATIEQIAATQEDITPSHKHMFRDFGVTLRQMKLLPQALLCTRRVVELSPEDDHAHFNLARILCQLNMFAEATEHMNEAMRASPTEPSYARLMNHINTQAALQTTSPKSGPDAAQHGTTDLPPHTWQPATGSHRP
jgi:tetratricopeptide (TPR) repeat protein